MELEVSHFPALQNAFRILDQQIEAEDTCQVSHVAELSTPPLSHNQPYLCPSSRRSRPSPRPVKPICFWRLAPGIHCLAESSVVRQRLANLDIGRTECTPSAASDEAPRHHRKKEKYTPDISYPLESSTPPACAAGSATCSIYTCVRRCLFYDSRSLHPSNVLA